MNRGLYEDLITKLIDNKLNDLDKDTYYVKITSVDKAAYINMTAFFSSSI